MNLRWGYDIVWHTGIIAQFNGTKLTLLEFENKQIYPVAVVFGDRYCFNTVAWSRHGSWLWDLLPTEPSIVNRTSSIADLEKRSFLHQSRWKFM